MLGNLAVFVKAEDVKGDLLTGTGEIVHRLQEHLVAVLEGADVVHSGFHISRCEIFHGADKSIRTGKYFTPMMQQKGDIRLLATPDALPMDVRGVLTWPHGTQLLGYVLFENGRIYATLQNADFKGNTKESNQPFHPQNSRELQQAMLNMMHGRAFNISLTSNELLTLSNLRVLMEYAPNEPEVNILYQLIMKIEELNLRGDKNRTNFTVVLNEKNENALKQLTDFAKLFIGM